MKVATIALGLAASLQLGSAKMALRKTNTHR
eukprot:CAMPEP_0195295276 /NCGR_PEP_ID=MMETSP0707-20130614/17007_1 /TAXON_ID=33640 /ORGANISM="Asterionellopsis glacialis, Strain CCMP134" /LENGTH=30 /DNA_ID= /DNA_START= /DNA_END= /DNA_ORIENTATION=